MNALLGYVYRAQAGSLSDYHYTATDIVLAIVLIAPSVLFLIALLFAVPIQEAINAWEKRKERQRQRARSRKGKREPKFEPVGRSRWHWKN